MINIAIVLLLIILLILSAMFIYYISTARLYKKLYGFYEMGDGKAENNEQS